ncbi:hypothetical protein FCV43_12225 [Vibrio genomosp. F6]|uniref:hypothetical protein n=1 Tax=Vibrio TaxID=662 RepID=UPI0010BCFD36|nr:MULTISPECIES: hypothetical protein [Vibrio]MDN3695793.1 hypothetical protein [Vibrio cortegadensis]TKF21161.1 hypothetical protein FCV43_12225 [Vibrio genomosp. F6]
MLSKIVSVLGINSIVTHFVDKEFKQTVDEPKIGSILYTGLLGDAMEHSGIYIGNGRIVELNSQGCIAEVSPEEFTNGGTGINIYVSSQGIHPVGSTLISDRAIQYKNDVGQKDYNLLFDNCHMFTAACMTSELDNAYSFLWMIKNLAGQSLGANNWLVWQKPAKTQAEIPPSPHYTQNDLQDAQAKYKTLREQSDHLWHEIKNFNKLMREHAENGPTTWFYTTDNRLDCYQRRARELEEISYVHMQKHKDLVGDEIKAEQKVHEIKAFLGVN